MYKITIIGATDGFGKWLAEFILREFFSEVSITITGRNKQKGERVSKDLGVSFLDNNIESVKEADIVVFSVPIGYMLETIKEVGPHIKSGSLVLDVCSIKGLPTDALKKYCNKGVTILPTHPMFGPFISSIAGKVFILTPDDEVKKDSRYKFLLKYLKKSGSEVIVSTPKEHDKMMAIVQALTHFDMFVFGETVRRLNLDVEKSMSFVSPIYKIMISSVARYVGQNPKLYGDIQMYNEEVLSVHNKFMEVTSDFNKFVKDKDEESFISTIEKTKKYFGNQTDVGQKYTDKIIYMIGDQIEKAEKSIGKEIVLKNIYNKKNIIGKLKKYEDNMLHLDGGKVYCLNEWEII